ncbi:MAG TPA: hypothetical protein VJ508_02835 [Saprospiraceae bacterium]|nr:hypothetical protein [Saprospiraceae bacterium]
MNEELRKELEEMASRIPPKKSPPPPAGYFDHLPDHLLDRWHSESRQDRVRRITLIKWMSVAALTIGLMFGGWWWLHPGSTEKPTPISSADAYQYVLDHINDFSTLMDQEAQWPVEFKLTTPDTASVQEYLMDELQDHDPEQLF